MKFVDILRNGISARYVLSLCWVLVDILCYLITIVLYVNRDWLGLSRLRSPLQKETKPQTPVTEKGTLARLR